jgi:hypothetical protein
VSELLQPWKDRPLFDFFTAPSDVKCLWNKGPAIWFPKVGPGTAATLEALRRPGPMHIGTLRT